MNSTVFLLFCMKQEEVLRYTVRAGQADVKSFIPRPELAFPLHPKNSLTTIVSD